MTRGIRIIYSDKELSFIQKNSKLPRKELAEKFNKKFNRNINFKNIEQLCQRKGWLNGRTCFFTKGKEPHNKDKKQIEWMSKEGIKNSSNTRFKKGNSPHNTNNMFDETICKDGYVYIKVRDDNANQNYTLKHHYLWEKKNGNIPKGMVLKCLDGDRCNTDPDNWELISKSVLPFLNGGFVGSFNYDKTSEELKPYILTLAKLKGKKSEIINKRLNKKLKY